jgi:hypothetical protein
MFVMFIDAGSIFYSGKCVLMLAVFIDAGSVIAARDVY